MEFEIESHERDGGLQSLRPGMPDVAGELREVLRDMAVLVHIARRKGSAADVKRRDLDSWALDINASEDRVYVLLSMGDPHVELDILRSESCGVDEVILRRFLPPFHDRAWTDDVRALNVVEDFLDLIGC